jgi:hypothetical protein
MYTHTHTHTQVRKHTCERTHTHSALRAHQIHTFYMTSDELVSALLLGCYLPVYCMLMHAAPPICMRPCFFTRNDSLPVCIFVVHDCVSEHHDSIVLMHKLSGAKHVLHFTKRDPITC